MAGRAGKVASVGETGICIFFDYHCFIIPVSGLGFRGFEAQSVNERAMKYVFSGLWKSSMQKRETHELSS